MRHFCAMPMGNAVYIWLYVGALHQGGTCTMTRRARPDATMDLATCRTMYAPDLSTCIWIVTPLSACSPDDIAVGCD